MNDRKNSDDDQVYEGFWGRLAGFVLILLVFLPALALVSYTWRDVPWLNAESSRAPENLIGLAGAVGAYAGYSLLGLAVWLVPGWMLIVGVRMLLGKFRHPWRSVFCASLFQIAVCSLFQLGEWTASVNSLHIWRGAAGGALGWFFTTICLKPIMGVVGCALIMIVIAILSMGFGIGWRNWCDLFLDIRDKIEERRLRNASEAERLEIEQRRLEKRLEAEKRQADREAAREERERRREEREAEKEARRQEREDRERQKEEEKAARERAYEEQKERLRQERERQEELERQRAAKAEADAKALADEAAAARNVPETEESDDEVGAPSEEADPPPPPYEMPSINLLRPLPPGKADYGNIEEKEKILVETLREFKLNVEVTDVARGPVVTIFELLPAPGIRPEQIAAMAKTIEMKLRATSIRIEAPIPGKGVVGVEIPNEKASSVTVREILEGPVWAEAARKMHLPMLLGKDSSGHDLICDLASMPHLLIAGATGSGKSVCMNAILTGLLMSRTPEELRLILVDPKVVEFTGYNAIPHLLVPIITDAKKVSLGLIWAIQEMEKRYHMLSAAGVKNIESYNNRKPVQPDLFEETANPAPKPRADLPEKLPYIVIVIDELADLMLQVGREIEDSISRLAAKARAVGIHLVLATQKPIVKVVTGTIKSNVPGRIAFQVAQRIDSQTIIDRQGAESLLGHGDMLFLNPRASKLTRAQGAFIGDEDAEAVCDFIRAQGGPRYVKSIQDQLESGNAEDAMEQPSSSRSPSGGQRGGGQRGGAQDGFGGGDESAQPAGAAGGDELYEAALEVVRRTHRASTSSLQRALRIGYTRAARLIDQMEEQGIVGPPRGADPREILVDLDAGIPSGPSGDSADADSGGESADTDEMA